MKKNHRENKRELYHWWITVASVSISRFNKRGCDVNHLCSVQVCSNTVTVVVSVHMIYSVYFFSNEKPHLILIMAKTQKNKKKTVKAYLLRTHKPCIIFA